ncbi:MAG: NAD(P)-dependent glycerol-3-phosphate dehydrogenase [Chloroflexi bacterium]|nr:NAD(P)-dependent glycerol-3-phosphate dehydrogenase [Chloroflexota bacterium]MBA3626580.1 NAD(P)-dependent glycerol-3-phosphate dehydrogenase [Chloroflexota bacterium]MBA3796250.1 NAD(P)-dependent glycerol-3-phosphate dehydrogenase [Chloroflexota bacterium]
MSGAARAVVGAGTWGTTLALLLARSGPVTLVARDKGQASALAETRENARYLPGVMLPVEIEVVTELEALSDAHDLVILAVPSGAMREVCAAAATSMTADAVLLSVAKGIERGSLRRMTQVVVEEIPSAAGRVAAMSGPNLALEVARGLPASSVIGAEDEAVSDRVIAILASRSFRLYRNRDVIGVELCGALKNIIAIAAGATDRLGFGDNGKAGLITRGLAEMTRLGVAAGANPLTFAGLAGIGDVLATCSSSLSRNHQLGVELAEGRRWTDIEGNLPGVAEGAYTVEAALAMAAQLGVEMPIAQEVHNALFEGKSVQRCLIDLLSRESKDELAGFESWLRERALAALSKD